MELSGERQPMEDRTLWHASVGSAVDCRAFICKREPGRPIVSKLVRIAGQRRLRQTDEKAAVGLMADSKAAQAIRLRCGLLNIPSASSSRCLSVRRVWSRRRSRLGGVHVRKQFSAGCAIDLPWQRSRPPWSVAAATPQGSLQHRSGRPRSGRRWRPVRGHLSGSAYK